MMLRAAARSVRRFFRDSMEFWKLGIWLCFLTALFVIGIKMLSDIGRQDVKRVHHPPLPVSPIQPQ